MFASSIALLPDMKCQMGLSHPDEVAINVLPAFRLSSRTGLTVLTSLLQVIRAPSELDPEPPTTSYSAHELSGRGRVSIRYESLNYSSMNSLLPALPTLLMLWASEQRAVHDINLTCHAQCRSSTVPSLPINRFVLYLLSTLCSVRAWIMSRMAVYLCNNRLLLDRGRWSSSPPIHPRLQLLRCHLFYQLPSSAI